MKPGQFINLISWSEARQQVYLRMCLCRWMICSEKLRKELDLKKYINELVHFNDFFHYLTIDDGMYSFSGNGNILVTSIKSDDILQN